MLDGHRVGRALLSLDAAAYQETATGDRLVAWLGQNANETRYLTPANASPAGQPSELFECGGTRIYILAASEPSHSSSESIQRNTPSVVLMLERELADGATFRAMLTGDATRETERAILARYDAAFLHVEVLKVGHHGSETSTFDPSDASYPWLATTTPALAVTTAGHHGGYHLPRCTVVDTVLEAPSLQPVMCHELECGEPPEASCPPGTGGGAAGHWCTFLTSSALLNTANNGDITVEVDAGGWRVDIARGEEPDAACE